MRATTLFFCFIICMSLLASPLRERELSMEQHFIVTNDAPNGEYVGTVKVFPEFAVVGDAPEFILYQDKSGIFSLTSSGLLTVEDNTFLNEGVIRLGVEVSKSGYENYRFPITVTVLSAENCVFVDPGASDLGEGTRESPQNSLPVFSDNTTVLLKRGTKMTMNGQVTINNKDSILIGSYGIGSKPILAAGDVYLFRFYSATNGEGPRNCTLRDLEITSADSCKEYPSDDYSNWMNAICYTSNQQANFSIQHCEIHHTHNGVTVNTSSGTDGEGISILWNYIHDVAQEGIYLQEIRGTGAVIGNRIERVNLLWNFSQEESVSSGDGIQTYNVDSVEVKHNYIDKSYTGNKFNIIAQYNQNSVSGLEWVEISDNYLIGNAGGINKSLSGAIIYADYNKGRITRNSLIGHDSTRGIASANSSIECEISYNLFRNCGDAINDPYAQVYNNLFYGCQRATARSENDFMNNIIFFTAPGQMAYSRHLSLNADYNLYNGEIENMFGSGFHTLDVLQPQKEKNSVVGDPLFLDTADNDYRILSNSPANEAGIKTGIALDFAKHVVGTSPNIGIFEGAIKSTGIINNASMKLTSKTKYTFIKDGKNIQLKLHGNYMNGICKYSLVSCNGKVLLQCNAAIVNGTIHFTVPSVSSGVYWLIFENSEFHKGLVVKMRL